MREKHIAREEAHNRRSNVLEKSLKKQLEEMTTILKEMMEKMKKQGKP